MKQYQFLVWQWMLECFGDEIALSKHERAARFLEEALELAQASGLTPKDVRALTSYVYGRPVGDPAQEVGGVMVCLAGLCQASEISLYKAALAELARCEKKTASIRAKHAAKPKDIKSPLPGKLP